MGLGLGADTLSTEVGLTSYKMAVFCAHVRELYEA
jgi:hypothetical protein